MLVDLAATRKFTGPRTCTTLMFHHPAVQVPVKGEKHRTKSKMLEYLIYFPVIFHNLYWIQAMVIPGALNIKKGDFHCHSHLLLFYWYYSAPNSILQCIYETLLWPLSPLNIYSFCWRIGVWRLPRFESCIQQRKTTSLLYIRISLACARASKLTTSIYFGIQRWWWSFPI